MPDTDLTDTWIVLADGTKRRLRRGECLPDGCRYARPLALRDSSTLRDAALTDAARADAAHRAMVADLANGWKSPQQVAREGLEPEWSTLGQSEREREVERAWAAMKEDLSRSWEGRPPVPTSSLQPGTLVASQVAATAPHSPNYTPSARDQYIAELREAWKHPNGWM